MLGIQNSQVHDLKLDFFSSGKQANTIELIFFATLDGYLSQIFKVILYLKKYIQRLRCSKFFFVIF